MSNEQQIAKIKNEPQVNEVSSISIVNQEDETKRLSIKVNETDKIIKSISFGKLIQNS